MLAEPLPPSGSALEAWNRPPRASLSSAAALIVSAFLATGTLAFVLLEQWSARDALYFSIITLSTVGYGDVVPKSHAGKLFCCGFILLGVSLISAALGAVFGRMKAALSSSSRAPQNHKSSAASAAASMVAIAVLMAAVVVFLEGWHPVDALYWSIVTCSSVGFGDLTPSPGSRGVALLLLLPAVGLFALQAAKLAQTVMNVEVELGG